ncbi:MAG: HPP family protein [Gammaproteobacteria bacterium]|nr:HPP family protein [Gammaproteobacteria bacterium]
MKKSLFKQFTSWMGWQANTTSHLEKIVSGTGGALGIFAIFWFSRDMLGLYGAALMVASMGASAVLLFAVPHGALSQPWPLLGGHVVSAIIGVTVAQYVPNMVIAGSVAVGGAILVMHYLRCIHPPGGATALSFVIGGPHVHSLGYHYVIEPVMVNAFIILFIAIVFNYVFEWRRYPVAWYKREQESEPEQPSPEVIGRGDLKFALRAMNLTLDVSEPDLEKLFLLAKQHASEVHLDIEEIAAGRYYSNGRYGEEWEVRYIVDEIQSSQPEEDIIRYNVVAGKRRHVRESVNRLDFARWAAYEVFLNENSWQRVSD